MDSPDIRETPELATGQAPADLTGLTTGAPTKAATGFRAVAVSLQRVFGEMGVGRGTKALAAMNQRGGWDCSSCAWPDPDDHRSVAEFCENGAKALAYEGTTEKAGREFFRQHSVQEMAARSDYWHGTTGRLVEPMVLRPGATHYEPISWADAFNMIGKTLRELDSPDEAIFYTSGRTSNEAAYVYQLFVRMFGTNNMPDCSNMCHESTSIALPPAVGIGKGTVTRGDIEQTDLLILMGQNPGTNHPRMLTSLQKAKRNGAKIIAVNPLHETGLLGFKNPQEARGLLGFATHLPDYYLQVKVNGDAALLKGWMKRFLELETAGAKGVVDRKFIAAKCDGFAELESHLRGLDWAEIEHDSGISRAVIEETAQLIASTPDFITCWAMGVTQHRHAVNTIRDIANFHLMRGAIGRPKAGLSPIRGHSNVQGDRTMGVWEKLKPEFAAALEREFGFTPPRENGLDTVHAIKAMHEGKAKVFFALGGNFISAVPDTAYSAEAMRKCKLTVHVSIKLNRSHLIHGETALILPCLGRTEIDHGANGPQFITTESSTGLVQRSQGKLEPASDDLLSEIGIICGVAKAALVQPSRADWSALSGDYDKIREHIARTVKGCDDYNAKVRQENGFYLPNGPRVGEYTTTSGRAQFLTSPLPKLDIKAGQLILTTIRSHDQFNTTIYGLDDRYRGVYNERRVVFMSEADMAERGLSKGDVVDLTSHYEGQKRRARTFIVVPYDIPAGCCAAYFPETNVLVPIDSYAIGSLCPTSKAIPVTVDRSGD